MSRKVEIDAFKFAELSNKANECAENWLIDGIELDCEVESLQEILTMMGFYKPKLYFSGFYSQSDYCAFECDYFSFERGFVKRIKVEYPQDTEFHEIAQSLHAIYARSFYKLRGKVNASDRGHCYCDVSYEFDNFETDFESWLDDFNNYAFKYLRNSYEYYCSKEYLTELCEINDYLFDSSGRII